jgi:ATP-dependent DNA helicase RecQ
MDMCVKLPQTKEEMFTVNGVGQRKFDKYGAQFMRVIHEFTGGSVEKLYFGDIAEVTSSRKTRRKVPKTEFYLTKQQAEEFPYAEIYPVTELAVKLSSLRDENTVKKITGAEISRMLLAEGYVSKSDDYLPQYTILPIGQEAGISKETRTSQKGNNYDVICCNEKAQRMIVSRYIKISADETETPNAETKKRI